MNFNRIILIVLDSLGVGELPDAQAFGDSGSNTLKHTFEKLKNLQIPHLESMGLLDLATIQTLRVPPAAFFTRMKERSQGKDTTTGHWEMMGLVLEKGFQTFPEGFPDSFMAEWSHATGCKFLGNKPASGTVIIDELGAQHLTTKAPIVYTSGDSVFQIACHEEVFGLQKLYDICKISRNLLDQSGYKVGRVIARPFIGKPGAFKRTGNRKDYSVIPHQETALDILSKEKISVTGIGKIPDIFAHHGVHKKYESHNDTEAIEATLLAMTQETQAGLIFTNLNDLDMVYGHRRDVAGYGKQLEFIDSSLPRIFAALHDNDLLVLTADHGNDPTYKGTDHTREYVPLIAYSHSFIKSSRDKKRLADRETFADLGATILDNFKLQPSLPGTSFLKDLTL